MTTILNMSRADGLLERLIKTQQMVRFQKLVVCLFFVVVNRMLAVGLLPRQNGDIWKVKRQSKTDEMRNSVHMPDLTT